MLDDHPMVRERAADVINSRDDPEVCGEAWDAKSSMEIMGGLRPDLALLDMSSKESFDLELIGKIGLGGGLELLHFAIEWMKSSEGI